MSAISSALAAFQAKFNAGLNSDVELVSLRTALQAENNAWNAFVTGKDNAGLDAMVQNAVAPLFLADTFAAHEWFNLMKNSQPFPIYAKIKSAYFNTPGFIGNLAGLQIISTASALIALETSSNQLFGWTYTAL